MIAGTASKAVGETRDFVISLATAFAATSDTVASATWTVPSGITNVTTSSTTTSVTIWLSGGTAGSRYDVSVAITTAAGRILVFYIGVTVTTI